MSNLAPFVAAVLKDKVMHELIKENELLREKNQFLNSIEITGHRGHPVYARGCLESGEYSDTGYRWNVKFEPGGPLSATEMKTSEMWTGGSFLGSMNDSDVRIFTHPSRGGVLSRFKLHTCHVFVLTEWEHEPQDVHETVARLSGNSYALLKFLFESDREGKRHTFLGSSWPVSENEKKILAIVNGSSATRNVLK